MAEPLKFDQTDRYNWQPVNAAVLPSSPKSPPGRAGEWLKGVLQNPKFPVALFIVGLEIALTLAYLYMIMGHVMLVNIPPPEQPPQWVIDQSRQMGYGWPTPTPSPEYLMANDQRVMSSLSWVFGFVLVWLLATWFIIALALHLFSKAFGGSGRYFPDVVSAIGYTYVPKVLAMAGVVLLVTQMPVYRVDVANYSEGDITRYMDPSSGYFLVMHGILLAGMLCSCALGVAAVRYADRISWKAAALVVGLPLVLYLAYSYL